MENNRKEYLVGINYFSGWWRQKPNKYCVLSNKDWRMDYPGRTALLGCFNDQETMDAEIITASDYAVDFFLMLWYVEKPDRHPHGTKLNNGIRQFLASQDNYRMKFAIEFCNHPPFEIIDMPQWEESCIEWIEAMKHPSYLRIGGKSVFKILGLHMFLEQNNNQIDKANDKILMLRRMAQEAGVGPLLIGGGVMPLEVPGIEMKEYLDKFDFLATYMDVPQMPLKNESYPYEQLFDMAHKGWELYSENSQLPYMPYLPAGWNPRPWGDQRPDFDLPDREQWRKALVSMIEALDKNRNLRLPNGTDEGQKVFNIYAWNEFGEGGIVAPTIGDGYMKLEEIKKLIR